MNKRKISVVLNMLIILLEVIGFVVTYKVNSRIAYEYYTEDSNILMMATSIIFVMFLIKNREIPNWLKQLKYISTICLSLTLFVVLVILAPMYNFDYITLLFDDSLLYQHFLCPILSIITFIFFDNLGKFSKKDNLIGVNLTIMYSFVLLILNLIGSIRGPYPFLMVKEQSIVSSIIWLVVILSLTYLIGLILRIAHMKFNRS